MVRYWAIWAALILAGGVPVALAVASPLLAWRDPVYIVAGFAGVAGLVLLLVQPLLMAGPVLGISAISGRRAHRWIGAALVGSVLIHVAGLWLTSPPDVIDALLFAAPTAFSVWGVVAMWAVFATALFAMFRHRWRISPRLWRVIHCALAVIIVAGTIAHAVLIDGTMEQLSKVALCVLVSAATFQAITARWRRSRR